MIIPGVNASFQAGCARANQQGESGKEVAGIVAAGQPPGTTQQGEAEAPPQQFFHLSLCGVRHGALD